MTREALDSALRDATRILSRAPLDVDDSSGTDVPIFYPYFVGVAEQIIADRTGTPIDKVEFSARVVEIANTDTFRTRVIMIETNASVLVDLRLLSFLEYYMTTAEGETTIKRALTMSAYDRARWVGEVDPGTEACSEADWNAGLCGGPT